MRSSLEVEVIHVVLNPTLQDCLRGDKLFIKYRVTERKKKFKWLCHSNYLSHVCKSVTTKRSMNQLAYFPFPELSCQTLRYVKGPSVPGTDMI